MFLHGESVGVVSWRGRTTVADLLTSNRAKKWFDSFDININTVDDSEPGDSDTYMILNYLQIKAVIFASHFDNNYCFNLLLLSITLLCLGQWKKCVHSYPFW